MLHYWLALILMGVAGAWFFSPHRGSWDPFSPLRFFPSYWLFVIGVSQLRLTDDEVPWSGKVWFAVGAALGCYALGCWLAAAVMRNRDLPPIRTLRPRMYTLWPIRNMLPLALMIAGSVLVLIYEYWVRGGVPVAAEDPEFRARVGLNPYLHRLALSVVPLLVIYGICLFQKTTIGLFRNLHHYVVLALGLLAVLSMDSRFFLGFVLQPLLVAFHYFRNSFTRRDLLFKFVPVVLVVVCSRPFFDSFRYLRYAEEQGLPQALAAIYFSIVANFQGLQRVLALVPNLHPYFYGMGGTLDFITAFVKHELNIDYYDYASFMMFRIYNNQPTFVGNVYGDFGFPGVCLYSTLFGSVMTISYQRMLTRPSILNLYCYCMLVTCAVWMLLTCVFTTLGFLYDLGLVAALNLFLSEKVSRLLPVEQCRAAVRAESELAETGF